MERPLDARILGKQIIREILYYVLTGPCGGALLALVSRQTHFSLISRVLKRIENKYTENLERRVQLGGRSQHERIGVPP